MSQFPGQSVDGQYPPDFWEPGGGYDRMKQAGMKVGPDARVRPQPMPMPPGADGGPQRSSADEAQQLQMAYQQFLGRQASPDEIQGWLSGAYGYGRSGNLTPIFEAIRQSAEAQQRPPIMGPGSRMPNLPPMPMPYPGLPSKGPKSGSPWDMTGTGPTNLPPGAQTLAGSQGFRGNMGQLPQRGPASPLGAQNMDRMRKAILGVPEY